jgi:hypothetical protein
MDDAVPDLPGQVARLLAGTIDLHQFYRWFVMNRTAIKLRGTDDEVDCHYAVHHSNRVMVSRRAKHLGAMELMLHQGRDASLRSA